MLLLALAVAACGDSTGYRVADGTYVSLVPTEEQIAVDDDGALPGGATTLRQDDVDQIAIEIEREQVTFLIDGVETATRDIVDRVDVTDSEGSGPLKAKKQVLHLGPRPLTLAGLVIDEPVIWPGSFEESPVITLKPRDPDERGPVVSCDATQPCLLLSSGFAAAGRYEDANDPELDHNPIDSIQIDGESITYARDDGDPLTTSVRTGSVSRACGLSESRVWDVPAELHLPIDDPVLIHTLCPSTPGAAIQLVIMDRSVVPVLAPLTEATEGNWCVPGPDCLLFAPA